MCIRDSHNTVSTPNTKGKLSVDPSVARNILRTSTKDWAYYVSGRPGPGFSPSRIVPNITRRVSRSFFVHCTSPAKETPFAQDRLDALELCLLKGLGGRHEVVYASSELEANDS